MDSFDNNDRTGRVNGVTDVDKTPLISVIVPIYNVEKYVRKCLDSLKNQTMKQIEVICIDDGSTDKSGVIADEYESSEFPIFRVIHTENRGLSAARNRGIDETKAEWLMFVDSDDWVDSEFCEIPYEKSKEYGADLVIFNAHYVRYGRKKQRKIFSESGIIEELLAHEIGGTEAWNKLYKKKLFNKIQYPVDMVFEDIALTHKLVHRAERICITPDCLYYHVRRKGSISNCHDFKNQRDRFISVTNRYNDLLSYGYPSEKLKDYLCGSAIAYCIYSSSDDNEMTKRAEQILRETKNIPRKLSFLKKGALVLWKLNPNLFKAIHTLARQSST